MSGSTELDPYVSNTHVAIPATSHAVAEAVARLNKAVLQGVPATATVTDLRAVLRALSSAEARIIAALEVMDESMVGDPEVPFRMRRALTGTDAFQSTYAYKEVHS